MDLDIFVFNFIVSIYNYYVSLIYFKFFANLFPNRTMGDIRHRPDDAYCRNQHPEMTHYESIGNTNFLKDVIKKTKNV